MDYYLFRVINRLSGRSYLLDNLMIFASNKLRYLFGLAMVVSYFRNFYDRKSATNAARSIIVLLFIGFVVNLFFYRPRPFMKRRVGILIPSKVNSSFPSKHTTLAFAIATSIYLRDRILGAMMFILSALMGFSRIWVGHHYPTDIAGSALIGTMTGYVVDKFSRNEIY
ncbi:MAG: undecaprenyl-diphosphatase [Anaerobacillus sp.]|uniref:undecaprenyl-diphosphatase n=1 Tax=Anaerobacillus sp. TaxID=1872506 RepID=UPI00391AA5B6